MSMIKSNYQIDGSDLHPISNLLMEAKTPYHGHNGPIVNSLAPILVATNIPNLQNANVISNDIVNKIKKNLEQKAFMISKQQNVRFRGGGEKKK